MEPLAGSQKPACNSRDSDFSGVPPYLPTAVQWVLSSQGVCCAGFWELPECHRAVEPSEELWLATVSVETTSFGQRAPWGQGTGFPRGMASFLLVSAAASVPSAELSRGANVVQGAQDEL